MNDNKRPLISVIVPVYDVEDCIEKCLDSILTQSYKIIEVILVDDGSRDESGVICDRYKAKDKRVIVVHKDNSGVSSARNIGLQKASGTLVCFVDGDDALRVKYLEELYLDMIREKADISICGFTRFENEDETSVSESNYSGRVTGSEAITLLLEGKIYASPWGKLYKREVFDNLRFDEKSRYGEDLDILMRILKKDVKITIDQSNKDYLYRTRPNSAMGKGVYRKTCRDLFEVCDKIIEAEKGGKNKKLAYEFYVSRVLSFCMDCIKYNRKDKAELEYLRGRLTKYQKEQSLYSSRTYQEKLNIFLFSHRCYYVIGILSGTKRKIGAFAKAFRG